MRNNSTHLTNVHKALLVEGLVIVSNFPNEFDPANWTLYVYYPQAGAASPSLEPQQPSYISIIIVATAILVVVGMVAVWVIRAGRIGRYAYLDQTANTSKSSLRSRLRLT